MAPEHKDNPHEGGYSPHMKTVAWAILVMGISIVLVIVLYLWFGQIGPSYSAGILQMQQGLKKTIWIAVTTDLEFAA